jgi:hypothetical protein
MVDKKLERLSVLILDLIKRSDLEGVWVTLLSLNDKYSDYFVKISKENFFKLFLLVYSLKTTGNFEWAYKNLKNIKFIDFIHTDLEEHVEECDNCGGDGSRTCALCDGSGTRECSNCDGSGTVECDECDGTGEIDSEDGSETCDECDGEGSYSCNDCAGEGSESCSECGGDGNMECDECDASGEMIDDIYKDYKVRRYLSWNKTLNDISEIRVNTERGISEDDFHTLTKEDCLMYMQYDDYGEPLEFVESDTFYVCFIDDLPPKIEFEGMKIRSRGTRDEFYFEK